MPCHVPSTRVSRRRRLPTLSSPPPIAATLDLSNPAERASHDFLRRACSGRWPLWRLLGMRRQGLTLFLAVEWVRCRSDSPYSLIELALDQLAMSWRLMPTAKAAREALARLDGEEPQTVALESESRGPCRQS